MKRRISAVFDFTDAVTGDILGNITDAWDAAIAEFCPCGVGGQCVVLGGHVTAQVVADDAPWPNHDGSCP